MLAWGSHFASFHTKPCDRIPGLRHYFGTLHILPVAETPISANIVASSNKLTPRTTRAWPNVKLGRFIDGCTKQMRHHWHCRALASRESFNRSSTMSVCGAAVSIMAQRRRRLDAISLNSGEARPFSDTASLVVSRSVSTERKCGFRLTAGNPINRRAQRQTSQEV